MAARKKSKGRGNLRVVRPVSPEEREWRRLHHVCQKDAAARVGESMRALQTCRHTIDELGEALDGHARTLLEELDANDLQGETLQMTAAVCIELMTSGLIKRRVAREQEAKDAAERKPGSVVGLRPYPNGLRPGEVRRGADGAERTNSVRPSVDHSTRGVNATLIAVDECSTFDPKAIGGGAAFAGEESERAGVPQEAPEGDASSERPPSQPA